MMKCVADSSSEEVYNTQVAKVHQSEAWKRNVQFRNWFSSQWLANRRVSTAKNYFALIWKEFE